MFDFIISYFDTYDCTHNGGEPPKDIIVILSRCQLYIKVPFKLHPEDSFIKAETCSCCVLLFKYILCNKAVLVYKFIYFINYILRYTALHPRIL